MVSLIHVDDSMLCGKQGAINCVQGEGKGEVQHQGIGSTEETFGELVSIENGSERRDVCGSNHARID